VETAAVTQPEGTGPEADRPWERPGAARRDCEPHRGNWLLLLAGLGLLFTLCSLCLAPFTLVSIPLGEVVLYMAQHDLRQMEAGLLDPRGRDVTERAKRWGLTAIVGSLVGLMLLPVAVFLWAYVVSGL
jgi:hypothetical protein